jgi:AraC family transcriptional regulator
MGSPSLANTLDEVSKLLRGTAPPVATDHLRGNTRVTGRWFNSPFDGYVPGLNEHCLVCHLGGKSEVWVKVEGKVESTTLLPGTVTIVPRGVDGWHRSNGRIEVSNVFLGADRLQDCADVAANGQSPEIIGRKGVSDPKLFAVMKLLSDEVELSGLGSRLFTEQAIDLMCLQLLRIHSSFSKPLQGTVRRGLAAWQVKRISTYMHDYIDQDIGLQDLANLVAMSRFHFCHAFRLATGHTPHGWLSKLRIERARQLLAVPELRIIDVALAVGYQTPSAFSASFRRALGITPTQYRVRLRN